MLRQALFAHHGVKAVRPATRGRKIKTGEAHLDRQGAVIEQREETAREMADEIGKRHLAGEDEGNRPRKQPEHQQPAKYQFEGARSSDQRKQLDFFEWRAGWKLQQLGNAELKQQKACNETKQAESRRLESGKHLVHVMSPCLTRY